MEREREEERGGEEHTSFSHSTEQIKTSCTFAMHGLAILAVALHHTILAVAPPRANPAVLALCLYVCVRVCVRACVRVPGGLGLQQ